MKRLVISNFKTGFEKDVQAFLLNNDAFPVLNNARLFRGRIQKNNGTALQGRLQRDFETVTISTSGASPWSFNLFTEFSSAGFALETNSEIKPGSVEIIVGAVTFTDNSDGTLTGDVGGNTGTINYISGAVVLTHTAGVGAATTVTLSYYPALPVLGLEEFVQGVNNPDTIYFDQKYSYRFDQTNRVYYDVSFYKATQNRLVWSGEDYEQFWGVSYRNALWVTNNNPGRHFKSIVSTTFGGITNVEVTAHGLSNNDWVFFNELTTATELNGRTARVTRVDDNNFTVPITTVANNGNNGIIQLLTSSLNNTQDGIRFYDGDPTAGSPPTNNGWVNFAPPLQNTGLTGGNPDYLVGALAIVPFKDRLLFFGVWIQKSTGNAVFFPNRMVYSQNGTPYYFDDSVILPLNQQGETEAWFQNVPARGGFLGAPVQQQFINSTEEGDVLICQFSESQRRLIYSQDDSFPFYYQDIDSELGTIHTFSGIPLDQGVLSIGSRGILLTTVNTCKRIDDNIPDEVFEISKFNNDEKRVTGIRDFRNEYAMWTFTPKDTDQEDDINKSFFPSKSLIFNYKTGSWFTADDHYTHYGYFSKNTSYTWATLPFKTWASWTNPWNYGGVGERFPQIIGGNQQGFVHLINFSSLEASSHRITAISGNTITSPNHDLKIGDFIIVESGIGITVDTSPASPLPSSARAVIKITDENTFIVDGEAFLGTLLGGATFRLVYNYDIRTKQFTEFWDIGERIEISEQKYLFGNVPGGQTSIFIYTNLNDDYAVNDQQYNNWSPVTNKLNLFPSTVFPGGGPGNQVWKTYSGSYGGDTIQLQFTLSPEQMRNPNYNEKDFVLHAIIADVSQSGEL